METFNPDFCFYDDPDLPVGSDADAWSPMLREAHRRLWSKQLGTGGDVLNLTPDLIATNPPSIRGLELSSDTIANTHNRYRRRQVDVLWEALPAEDKQRYDRGFYKLGGFIVFPCHRNSLNQQRGTRGRIDDRFDVTLECIRLYYDGVTSVDRNPLGDVLIGDAAFFDLFGQGLQGFAHYVDFFHLSGLVADGRIQWFDDFDGDDRPFVESPLPKTGPAYVRYLENVLDFVDRRSIAMAAAISVGEEAGSN